MVDGAIAQDDVAALLVLVSIYAAMIVAQQVTKFAYNFVRGKTTERLVRLMRDAIIAESQNNNIAEGAAVSMVTSEVEPVGGFGGDAFAQPVTEVGVLLTIFGYMLYTEFWLALVAIIVFVPQAVMTPLVQEKINEQSAQRISEIREAGDATLDVMHQRDGAVSDAVGHVRNVFGIRLLIYRLKFALKAALNLMDHIADLAILGVGGFMVINDQTQIGVVVAFLSGLGKLRSPWRTMITYFRIASDAVLKFDLLSQHTDLSSRTVKARGA